MGRASAAMGLGMLALVAGCGSSGAKGEYILAEKLWEERSYAAAAAQFERAFAKDQKGELGRQALYRAATTQHIFNHRYPEALVLYRKYLEIEPKGLASRDAEIQVGEILFGKTRQFEQAIQHYRRWIRERPGDPLNEAYLFRIGRAQLELWQFEDAIQTFGQLVEGGASGTWAPESLYQIGMSHLALADQGQDLGSTDEGAGKPGGGGRKDEYRLAMAAFDRVVEKYPATKAAQEARLGQATVNEELGLWAEALAVLAPLEATYPLPQVVKIRTTRIKERLARQNPPLKRK